MNDLDLTLELPYVKLPYDVSVKNFKQTRKIIEKEMSSVINSIVQMKSQTQISKQEAKTTITSLIGRLNSLKRKINEDYVKQDEIYESCKKRIQHLNSVSKEPSKNQEDYHINRLRRIIIDYLQREGHTKTAYQMMKIYSLQPHTEIDLEIIEERNLIIEELKNHKVEKALEWCQDNKSKLVKLNSDLEFYLFLQQYIEYIKQNDKQKALIYLRQNSEQYKQKHIKHIEILSCILAIDPKNLEKFPRYSHYFDDEQWQNLITLFKHEVYNVFSLTSKSLLSLSLSTGLSCLKTLSCFDPVHQRKEKCPVCQDEMQILSKNLRPTHKIKSSLICRISGEVMDEDNPPIYLPNGQVYGEKSLKQISKNGEFTCPITKTQYKLQQDTKKIFLA